MPQTSVSMPPVVALAPSIVPRTQVGDAMPHAAAELRPIKPAGSGIRRLLPRGLTWRLGLRRSLPVTAATPPAPSFAVPPPPSHAATHLTQGPETIATPPYPAGSGTQPVTVKAGMMDRDVLAVAERMRAQNLSFVSAVSDSPFATTLQFEHNLRTFQVLQGPRQADWDAVTQQMTAVGWHYFGRRSQGVLNQVLIYVR